MYDTGPAFRTGRDTGELVILPFLRSAGIRHLDTLMVSHSDLDHIGGMHSLLKAMPTQALIVGPSIASVQEQVNTTQCRRGRRWQWDGVDFQVLHPGITYGHENDSSCVLRVSASGGSALLTGDIEKPGEIALAAHGLPRTDVVVVAHHGSRSSSTAELIEAARARFAIFSAGYRNRWGFPQPDVVRRWQQAGASTLSTIDSGAIAIMVDAAGVHAPREYRREHRRYWSAR
jgi:competence protein ComEC